MPEHGRLRTTLTKNPRQKVIYFFFNDTATTKIYTLPLHDALPICLKLGGVRGVSESVYASGNIGVSYIGSSISSTTGIVSSTSGGSGTQYTFYANVTYSLAQ